MKKIIALMASLVAGVAFSQTDTSFVVVSNAPSTDDADGISPLVQVLVTDRDSGATYLTVPYVAGSSFTFDLSPYAASFADEGVYIQFADASGYGPNLVSDGSPGSILLDFTGSDTADMVQSSLPFDYSPPPVPEPSTNSFFLLLLLILTILWVRSRLPQQRFCQLLPGLMGLNHIFCFVLAS
jgi:hypothetical protein